MDATAQTAEMRMIMTDTNKLAELIKKAKSKMWGKTFHSELERNMFVADYLLANGVIVPPCKVGDTVYYIAFGKVYKSKCHAITQHKHALQIHLYDYDGDNAKYPAKKVFLTKEEAEQALAERKK